MGPTKRVLAAELMERLRAALRPAAACCTSARASGIRASSCRAGRSTCYWRKDGEPLWHDPALFADERDDHGATAAQAREFLQRAGAAPRRRSPTVRLPGLRGRLVLPVARAQAAGQRRSVRLAPRRPAGARRACARCSSRASTSRSATCCRSRVDERQPARWQTGPWFLRDERCYLIPGDSPMGYRLPLDSLPWAARRRPAVDLSARPDADLPPLPRASRAIRDGPCAQAGTRRREPAARGVAEHATPSGDARRRATAPRSARRRDAPAPFESAGWIARTAICAEPRDGRALRLHAADRGARGLPRARRRGRGHRARRCGCRSSLEGYEPPRDPRLEAAARHARPGRDRGQHPSGARAGTSWSSRRRILYERGARDAPDDREVHARRPPHRHRRRQPLRARRRDAGRLAVPAPARPARQPDRLLAQPSVAVLPVLGHVHRPDQPGAAHRRGAQRLGLRARDRVRRAARVSRGRAPASRRPGWSTACCATC